MIVVSDEDLHTAWRSGDRDAGEQLFDRYFSQLHRFFRNKLDGTTEADDLVQQTFAGCVDARQTFAQRSSFRTYLFGIAHNVLLMYFRTRRRKQDPIDFGTISVVDLGASPSEVVGRRDEERLLLAALRRLPLELQVTLELHYWESMSSAEIGEVLDILPGTIRHRLARARQLLEVQMLEVSRDPALVEVTTNELSRWVESTRGLIS
jgi:RNA polymerase sigma-70 factor (ECF subfamily)